MFFWVAQAVVFGVAISEAAGNLSLGDVSLSSGANSDGNDGFDPANIIFEFLNQCAEANLDLDSCLVSTTLDVFMEMNGPPTNGTGPTRRRFLQEEEDDCGPPDMNEQDLRLIMDGSKNQCNESGGSISDQEFESAVSGLFTLFDSESCFQQMCKDESILSEILIEIIFDEAAKCAQVELDMPQCLRDQVLEMIFMEEDSAINNETDSLRRRLSRTLSHTMDDQNSSYDNTDSCEQPSNSELSLGFSFMLMGAEAKCSEFDVSLSSQELAKAISDLVAIFSAQNCWGDVGCDEIHDPDDHHNDPNTGNDNGVDYFNIAIKYVEQCAELDLNETCLVSSTIGLFTGSNDVAPSGPSSFNESKPSGHRFLEDECVPPEFDKLTMRLIIEGSMQQCIIDGHAISDQEFEETVVDFMDLFGAQDCWVALCEEEDNPSELFLKIMFEEIGKCAGADMDFNPCLMDQIFALVSSPDGSDGAFGGVRRKLEQSFSDGPGESDKLSDPCTEQTDDNEINFIVNLLLAGAQEQCMELGETLEIGEVAKAEAELFKLFSAQHCWGVPDDCDDHNDEKRSDYLEFIEESTTWMLGQCADVEDISCVFSRSIEVMHGMKHLGWSHAGSVDPHHITAEYALGICSPPSDKYDIELIADHAKEYCTDAGVSVLNYHYDQAVNDLKNLVAKPDCWKDLCEPEIKDAIVEEWMHDCASVDLKFMTSQGQDTSEDASLDNDRLRCMAIYIASKNGSQGKWECSIPHLGHGACNQDTSKEAYIHCGGEVQTHPPSPSPSMHSSMSLAYNDEDQYSWAAYEPEMSMSNSLGHPISEDGLSMSYYDDHESDSDWYSQMLLYIEEVCDLISDLNSDDAMICLKPVCDDLWIEDALMFDDGEFSMPTTESTLMPTMAPTKIPISTKESTSIPTLKPTTRKPTTSPTVLEFGSVMVSVEVEIKLEGIDMTDIDVTALDKVVDLLESVLGEMLPDGTIVRLLSVGGFSVARRLLRFLEEPSGGVDVQFEIIMSKTCSSSKCDASEADEISETLYQNVSSDLKAKVESGDLTTAIQAEAESAGVSQLSNVSVNASTMQVSQATVTVKDANEDQLPADPKDDDDSASTRLGVALSLLVALGSVLLI